MNRILMAIILVTATAIFTQGQKQKTVPSAEPAVAVAEVRRIIEKGNAQWVEAWAKGDPSMTASLFAEDGVQLAWKAN